MTANVIEPTDVDGLVAASPDAPTPGTTVARKQMSGLRKAAVFLAQMSSEEAGVILSRLRGSEVEALTTEVMRLRAVDHEDAKEVLADFHTMMQARQFVGQGGVEFAREILAAGLGRERAEEILDRLNVVFTEMPFSALRNADIRQIATFLKDEHPQIIALVLAHMQSTQSADVLSRLSPESQADVAHRIATMDRSGPEIIRMVEEELSRRMGSVLAHQDMATVGGVASLVEIINRSDRATERSILEWLEKEDPELAERVRSQMFVFEDIINLDDRSLQMVLRSVETPDLATALKGVSEGVSEKVMSNLSERAGAALVEEMDLMGAVRLKTVEEAQAKIVQVIRGLESSGDITLSRGGDDVFVA